MRKILFLCHGNICRSVAAEVIALNYVKEHHKESEFLFLSRALSLEEIGNDIYPPMRRVLEQNEKYIISHYAKMVTKKEMEDYDEIYYMDDSNLRLISYYFGDLVLKCKRLTFYLDNHVVDDPWYTREFLHSYQEIKEAVIAIINAK